MFFFPRGRVFQWFAVSWVSRTTLIDRWRKDCGGIRSVQAMRMKELEKQHARLKKLVA